MQRYAKAGLGFCVISAAYISAAFFGLIMLVMSDCVLSNAQIAAGQVCSPPADRLFWPAVIAASIGFVLVQGLYLRWALRAPPCDDGD